MEGPVAVRRQADKPIKFRSDLEKYVRYLLKDGQCEKPEIQEGYISIIRCFPN